MVDPTEHISKLSNDLSSIDGRIISRTKFLKQLRTRVAGYGKAAKSSTKATDDLIKRIGIAERQNSCLEASKAALASHHTSSLYRAAQSEVPSRCCAFMMMNAMGKDCGFKFHHDLCAVHFELVCTAGLLRICLQMADAEHAVTGMLQTAKSKLLHIIERHIFVK